MIKQTIAALLLMTGAASALDINVIINSQDIRPVAEVEQSAVNTNICRVYYRPSLDAPDIINEPCATATWGQFATENHRTIVGVDLSSTLANPQAAAPRAPGFLGIPAYLEDEPNGSYQDGVDNYYFEDTLQNRVAWFNVNERFIDSSFGTWEFRINGRGVAVVDYIFDNTNNFQLTYRPSQDNYRLVYLNRVTVWGNTILEAAQNLVGEDITAGRLLNQYRGQVLVEDSIIEGSISELPIQDDVAALILEVTQ